MRSDSVIKLVSDLITESDQAVRAVHSCNSWFSNVIVNAWPSAALGLQSKSVHIVDLAALVLYDIL